MNNIVIYTDGASGNKKGKSGGAASLIIHKNKRYTIQTGYDNTSVSRMELIAVIQALDALMTPNCSIQIYSDAQYVVSPFKTGSIYTWEKDKFIDKANDDLWKKLLVQVRRFKRVQFNWVRGHDGNEGNELCDRLAKQAKHFTDRLQDLPAKGFSETEL